MNLYNIDSFRKDHDIYDQPSINVDQLQMKTFFLGIITRLHFYISLTESNQSLDSSRLIIS